LQRHGVGIIGEDIFINHEPAQPNNTLTVYDYGSDRPRWMSGNERTGYRTQDFNVQVRARGKNDADVQALLQKTRVLLYKLERFEDDGAADGEMYSYLRGAWNISANTSLPRDSNGLIFYVNNWRVRRGGDAVYWGAIRISEDGDVRVAEDGLVRSGEGV